jgi:hypothetical protein
MALRIRTSEVEDVLASAGSNPSEFLDLDWLPGYRCAPDGPRAVTVLHDGPGEAAGLAAYTSDLRAAGYHVVADRPHGTRHRLTVTRF